MLNGATDWVRLIEGLVSMRLLPAMLTLLSLTLLSACAGGPHRSPYAPPGPPNDPWGPYIKQASRRFNVPQQWIRAVMHVESGGHEYLHGHLTRSSAGAVGLMQLEPSTYREMAEAYGLGSNPYDPRNNIMAGAAYIRRMYDIYGSPGFLAAYNAGPGAVDAYLDHHRRLPQQTRHYLALIAPRIRGIYPGGSSHSAMPAPSVPHPSADGHRWAAQVGAYRSERRAQRALGIAVARTRIAARARVVRTKTSRGIFYRALFDGIKKDHARSICHRLEHSPTGCAVVALR